MGKGLIKKQNLKKNFVFQILYQIIIVVIPLVVSPYLTRTLGDEPLGIYTYTKSIAYYFILLACLGISKHGQRIISERINDEVLLRKTFWSLFSVHAFLSVIAIALYIGFVFLFGQQYLAVYLFQIFYVASALFDITWLFYGLENFKSVVIKNLFVKILECVLVFTLVKSPNDLWLYTLIAAGSFFLGQFIMAPQALRFIKPIKFGWKDVKEHIKPLLILSIVVIASTLYTIFDKTLLGILTTKEDVAYYDCSYKIIYVAVSVISVAGTILYPRACKCIKEQKTDKLQTYSKFSQHFTYFVGVGTLFGLLGVANLFGVIYYGEDFAVCGDVMMCMAPIVLISGIGDIFRSLYIVPNKLDKHFAISIVINAVVNIILSVILIPYIGIYGAVVGTISAEFVGLIYQAVISRKFFNMPKLLLGIIPYAIFGALMFGVIYLIRMFYNTTLLHLILQIGVGAVVYCLACFIYLFFFSNIKQEVKGIFKKIFRRKKQEDVEAEN